MELRELSTEETAEVLKRDLSAHVHVPREHLVELAWHADVPPTGYHTEVFHDTDGREYALYVKDGGSDVAGGYEVMDSPYPP